MVLTCNDRIASWNLEDPFFFPPLDSLEFFLSHSTAHSSRIRRSVQALAVFPGSKMCIVSNTDYFFPITPPFHNPILSQTQFSRRDRQQWCTLVKSVVYNVWFRVVPASSLLPPLLRAVLVMVNKTPGPGGSSAKKGRQYYGFGELCKLS